MTVTYTTAALVKKRVQDLDVSLTDGDLEENINNAEGQIDAVMRDSLISTFDATKHQILRGCATDIAAYYSIIYDPGGSFLTLADAELTANLLWNSSKRSLEILSDPRTVQYLKSL